MAPWPGEAKASRTRPSSSAASLSNTLDADLHLRAGAALADLRDAGIWIVGSGMSFHNMRGYGNPAFAPVSDTFDQWLTDAVQAEPARRNILLREWETAPAARLSHPLSDAPEAATA